VKRRWALSPAQIAIALRSEGVQHGLARRMGEIPFALHLRKQVRHRGAVAGRSTNQALIEIEEQGERG